MYTLFAQKKFLNKGQKHHEKVFHKCKNYPKYTVRQVLRHVQHVKKEHIQNILDLNPEKTLLPNKLEEPLNCHTSPGQKKGVEFIIQPIKKWMRNNLLNHVKPAVAYKGRKLGFYFN